MIEPETCASAIASCLDAFGVLSTSQLKQLLSDRYSSSTIPVVCCNLVQDGVLEAIGRVPGRGGGATLYRLA